MTNTKILTDKMFMEDSVIVPNHRTFWVRTQIIGGYGLHKNKFGVSELDEVVFETENMVPLIGVQYAMEQLFGVKGPIPAPTLNNVSGIGTQSSVLTSSNGMPYPYGHRVCLFGIGMGGAKSNNIEANEVNYNETDVSTPIPFRYTNDIITGTDATKYYGRKDIDGITAYFLKEFDADPTIHHVYKNGINGEDGDEIDSTYFTNDKGYGVESFAEASLTISKQDVREWFERPNNIDIPRFNSIGLYSAVKDTATSSANPDYAQIQLFSKLNIPTETLTLTKDMKILYRTYGA